MAQEKCILFFSDGPTEHRYLFALSSCDAANPMRTNEPRMGAGGLQFRQKAVASNQVPCLGLIKQLPDH
jgi:hypothetical protein